MRYGCYSLRGEFKEGNLDFIRIGCEIHACGSKLLSGSDQPSAKGHVEQIRAQGVSLMNSPRGANALALPGFKIVEDVYGS